MTNIAVKCCEHIHHVLWEHQLQMAISDSYVSHYQRVSTVIRHVDMSFIAVKKYGQHIGANGKCQGIFRNPWG